MSASDPHAFSPAAGTSRPELRWQRDPAWLGAPFDDSLVMLDIASGRYFGLNSGAVAIWSLLDEPTTAAALVERLLLQFAVSADVCAAAVERTLRQLGEIGAIRPV